ncbi:MAG: acyl carrier protein [Deltaproteobacteria bacterium]|nr:acyl carrier protein [Deltaproteobacteria bacterium]
MEELILKLKEEIITLLNLFELTPEDIETEAPLFGDGLGLDSIDAMELFMHLEKNYGLTIENPKEMRKIFTSVKTMAEYIVANKEN